MSEPQPGNAPFKLPARAERGGAYIATLFALVLLTILALSIAQVTQTEMVIGANERTINRVFYAADSGISFAIVRALLGADYEAKTYSLDESSHLSSLEHEIGVSPFYPLLNGPCNLCEINNPGQYGEKHYYRTNHGVTSRATRQVTGGSTVVGFKTVSAMVEVQPWDPPMEAFEPLNDPAALENIKF